MPRGRYAGSKGEISAIRIKALLDSQTTPIANNIVVATLQKLYGKTRREWATNLCNHFKAPSFNSSILADYTRRTINNKFYICKRNADRTLDSDPPEKGISRDYKHDSQELLENLMQRERISWSKCGTTPAYNEELTAVEYWYEHREEDVTPYCSNWALVEQSAWLYCSSIKRPQDVYGRSGGRIIDSWFSRINGR